MASFVSRICLTVGKNPSTNSTRCVPIILSTLHFAENILLILSKQTTDSSVNDILKFRKALTYMDLEHPFGEAFGPASTRDELIHSTQILYQRLLRLAPGAYALPYSVLAILTENDDGTLDRGMKKSLENLFRPEADGEIPIVTFIQSCDVVYRKLRYFRASVGNASVIDKVLESIINGVFAFGLTIVILSLLNLNPWPLLVSVSTLLVSFAFAIGPTVAKAIEVSFAQFTHLEYVVSNVFLALQGIILIVGTRYVIVIQTHGCLKCRIWELTVYVNLRIHRPFDIGDRIIIANTPGQPTPGVGDSWFVEGTCSCENNMRTGLLDAKSLFGKISLYLARLSDLESIMKSPLSATVQLPVLASPIVPRAKVLS